MEVHPIIARAIELLSFCLKSFSCGTCLTALLTRVLLTCSKKILVPRFGILLFWILNLGGSLLVANFHHLPL